jgi:hypothetical protein
MLDLGVKITETYCAVGQYVDLGAQYSVNLVCGCFSSQQHNVFPED